MEGASPLNFMKQAAMCPSEHRDAQALRGDGRLSRIDDLTVFYMAPELHRLLLGFFFFAADEGDHIVDHFGPRLKRLTSAGDRLIGADEGAFQTVFAQRVQRGNVASGASSWI